MTTEQQATFCHIHNVDEWGDLNSIVCPECGHTYPNWQDMQAQDEETAREHQSEQEAEAVYVKREEFMFCPLCLHDFPWTVVAGDFDA